MMKVQHTDDDPIYLTITILMQCMKFLTPDINRMNRPKKELKEALIGNILQNLINLTSQSVLQCRFPKQIFLSLTATRFCPLSIRRILPSTKFSHSTLHFPFFFPFLFRAQLSSVSSTKHQKSAFYIFVLISFSSVCLWFAERERERERILVFDCQQCRIFECNIRMHVSKYV